MKKLLTLLLCIIAFCSCSPRIVLDSTYRGDHYMLTSDSHLFSNDGDNIDIALGVKANERDTTLAVLVTCDMPADSGVFRRGDALYLTLNDGEKITLTNTYDREVEHKTNTTVTDTYRLDTRLRYVYSRRADCVFIAPVTHVTTIPHLNVSETTYSYALYPIRYQQLQDIISKGVKSLTIEVNHADVHMPNPETAAQDFNALFDCLVKGE